MSSVVSIGTFGSSASTPLLSSRNERPSTSRGAHADIESLPHAGTAMPVARGSGHFLSRLRSYGTMNRLPRNASSAKWFAFGGTVRKTAAGLTSSDRMTQSIFDMLNADRDFQEIVAGMTVAPGTSLHFSLPEEGMDECYRLLRSAYPAPEHVELRAPGRNEPDATAFNEVEDMLPQLTFVLIDVKKRGRAAFSETAAMNDHGTEIRPYERMAQLKYVVRSETHAELAALVQERLANGQEELVVRHVAAQFLARTFKSSSAWGPLMASVTLTAGLSYLLEEKAVGRFSKAIFAKEMAELGLTEITRLVYAKAPGYKRLLDVLVKALPSTILEGLDLLIVKSAMKAIANEPVTWEYISSQLGEAGLGGMVAALLSMPDKADPFIRLKSETVADVIAPLAGALATIGSAFMVTKMLYKQSQKTPAALLELYGPEGPLALPDTVKDQDTLREHVTALASEGLNSGGPAVNRASILLAGILGIALNQATRPLPESLRETIKLTINMPVELWTLNLAGSVHRKLGGEKTLRAELLALTEQAAMEPGAAKPDTDISLARAGELASKTGEQIANAIYAVWAWLWFGVLTAAANRTPAAPSRRVPYDNFRFSPAGATAGAGGAAPAEMPPMEADSRSQPPGTAHSMQDEPGARPPQIQRRASV